MSLFKVVWSVFAAATAILFDVVVCSVFAAATASLFGITARILLVVLLTEFVVVEAAMAVSLFLLARGGSLFRIWSSLDPLPSESATAATTDESSPIASCSFPFSSAMTSAWSCSFWFSSHGSSDAAMALSSDAVLTVSDVASTALCPFSFSLDASSDAAMALLSDGALMVSDAAFEVL